MTEENLLNSEHVDASAPVEAEKMLPISRVNDLVRGAKLDGARKMQEELEALKRENEQLRQSQSLGGMNRAEPIDPAAIQQQVYDRLVQNMTAQQEAAQQERLQQQAEQMAREYHGKLAAGKQLYDDFDTVMSDFSPEAFPQLVFMANQADNTASIMYELAKNPQKLATLSVLAERDPKAAQAMIGKLSSSIKANEQAKAQEQTANEPLSRLQSSPVGQDTGAASSFADFKRMFKG